MLAIARLGFLGFPHSADEYVYRYQARTLLQGRLVNPPLPDPSFDFTHVVADPRGTYGKYQPGWPVVLALGELAGVPLAVNPLLSVLLLVLAWRLAREVYGEPTARVATLLIGTSPFFLLNGASFYSHPLVGLAVLFGTFGLWRYARGRRVPWLLAAAAALGAVGVTRAFDAALLGTAALPFAAALWLRPPRSRPSHLLAALAVLLAFAALQLLYNGLTTGDPWLPGHRLYAAVDRPQLAGLFYPGPTVRRLREYSLFGYPLLLLVPALWMLRREPPRSASTFAAVIVLGVWIGYAAYPIDPPPRLGPRYLYASHAFACGLLAAALVRALRPAWLVPLVVTLALAQLAQTALLTLELHALIRAGTGLYRAGALLERALAPQRALVIVAGPSGTVPEPDLARNDLDFSQPVLYARRPGPDLSAAGRPLRDRRVYYWDGIGGPPVLWTADPDAPVQQLVAGDGKGWALPRQPAEGWLAVFGPSNCAPLPYLSLMWRGLFPPDRISDVQRFSEGSFGPCPGFAEVRELARPELPADLSRRLAVTGHFRSFLGVERPGRYVFRLRANEAARLRVGGETVLESRDDRPRSAGLELEAATYPIALSHSTLWTPPRLELRIEPPPGSDPGFRLDSQIPAGARFEAWLPESALGRF